MIKTGHLLVSKTDAEGDLIIDGRLHVFSMKFTMTPHFMGREGDGYITPKIEHWQHDFELDELEVCPLDDQENYIELMGKDKNDLIDKIKEEVIAHFGDSMCNY